MMNLSVVEAGPKHKRKVIMWDEDEEDVFGVLDEHNLESESDDDFADLEFDSEMAEDAEEEDFDKEY